MVIAAINSVLRTLISTVLGVLFGSMIAYVLSRKELVAKKFITSYFLVTMYISAGLIPNYFLMKDLKMINSFAVYVVPGLVSVYNIIVIRSFIQGLPESLTEAAATQSGRDLSSVYGNGQQVANTITPTSIRAAVTIVASAPILVVYPFLQKYFVKGVTLGATKG